MTGPREPTAGGGRVRASDAERERVLETLKSAFVAGRLSRDELDARAGRALSARNRADLAALTADLPPGAVVPAAPARRVPPAPVPSARPAGARPDTRSAEVRWPLVKAAAGSGVCLVIALASIGAAEHLDPFSGPTSPRALVMLAFFAIFLAFAILLGGVGVSVSQWRARRRLTPPSGPGARTLDAGPA